MGSTVPAGYLICNGSAVSRTAYDKLFQAIGTKYGEGDGSTTFNLPNLIGKFLQGDVTSGTVKNAGLPNITGRFNPYAESAGGYADGPFYWISSSQPGWGTASGIDNDNNLIGFDASRSSSIYGNSTTVQPPAVTSIPCIKAFDSVIDATTVSVAQLSDTKVNKDLSNLDENGRKVIADGNLTKSGWTKLANGLILQWGSQYYGDIYENSPHPISFNIPFPNDCLQVIVSTSDPGAGFGLAIRVGEPTKTTFSYAVYEFSAVVQSVTVLWFAVGY